MNSINWKNKLTSRKFWVTIIGFVTGLLLYLGESPEKTERIGALIMSGASVIAYVIGEGLIDAANAGVMEVELLDDDQEIIKPPEGNNG